MCEHIFKYGGVKYEIDPQPLSGTGAKTVWYFDWYYCEKCLFETFRRLEERGTTYEVIKFNATPKRA